MKIKPEKMSVTRQRTISLSGYESESISLTLTCNLESNRVKIAETESIAVSELDDIDKNFETIYKRLGDKLDRKEHFIRKQVIDNDWHEDERYKEKLNACKKRILASKKSKK